MEDQVLLFGEQFRHMVDVIDAKLDRIELNQEHLKEMLEHRLGYLQKQGKDHEVRSGLTSAGSGLLSILKAFFAAQAR